tara:strand:+ start:4075 stop:4470 length:396 start_codon:yes stop_codon:yes gene_type:complete
MQKFLRLFVLIILVVILIFWYLYNSGSNVNFKKYYLKYKNTVSETKLFFEESRNPSEATYFVQLGIFAKQEEVDKIRARTLLLGLNVDLSKQLLKGKIVTKVTLGPYNKKILSDTEKILKKNNIKYLVINE